MAVTGCVWCHEEEDERRWKRSRGRQSPGVVGAAKRLSRPRQTARDNAPLMGAGGGDDGALFSRPAKNSAPTY